MADWLDVLFWAVMILGFGWVGFARFVMVTM